MPDREHVPASSGVASGSRRLLDAPFGSRENPVRQGARLSRGGRPHLQGNPYGQNTGGENRWLPAKAPKPWDGEYPALVYGANCPQRLHDFTAIEQSFLYDWDDGYMSEDMLKLNVWTPVSDRQAPRDGLFSRRRLHLRLGLRTAVAGWRADGPASRRGSVSVNHRLNVLGFLDVSEIGGAAYADSVNVGMTDLVAALRWVRENIANFGGDPDAVMIYGQSGGGSKVTCLMGMPSAAGLFHRASVQSGGGGNIPGTEQSRELARQFMKELGLRPNDLAALQKMDWAKLNAAGNAAIAKLNPAAPAAAGPGGPPSATPRVGWSPTVDGKIVTMRSFYDVAPEISKNVPMLIGKVSEEGNRMSSRPTEAEWHATLARSMGRAKATALIAAMKKAHPGKEHPHAVLRRERAHVAQQRRSAWSS